MRLRRLDLVRFGHFTETVLDLPRGDLDFHIVFGSNEAGKSTALAAIEDLLFGIPTRSPYNFLHDYKNMRIGAVIERDGSVLEVSRRKGTKDTLLNIDNRPLTGGDGTLRPFLEAADRSFFERMFSLDHTRLKRGGEEILSASDEVGQMLFSAGAGIGGLRDRLAKLDEEADGLWGSRRSTKRLYTQAEDRLKEAQHALREHTLTAKNWNDLHRALEDAERRCNEIDDEIRSKSAYAKRLGRIRRVYRYVRQKAQLEERIAELGVVVALPEDAAETLESAEREEFAATTRIEAVATQLARAREELGKLSYDEALLARANDVRQLDERRIEIRREKADLPKRRAELDAAEKEFLTLAKELGWHDATVDQLLERIPARSVVKVVSTLLAHRGALDEAATNATREREEADAEVRRLQGEIVAFGQPPDVSNLEATVKAVRQMGDVGERVVSAKRKLLDAEKRVEKLRDSLEPSAQNASDVAGIKVPSMGDIQQLRDELRECERRQRETNTQTQTAENDLSLARTEFQQTVRDERAVTRGELEESRNARNALWNLVKRKHIEGAAIADDERARYAEEFRDLPGTFEANMTAADRVADDRFDNAEASGRLAEMSRSIELKEEQIEQLKTTAKGVETEKVRIDAHWTSIWFDAPFEPLSPDAMMDWLTLRGELIEAMEAQEQDSSAFEAACTQEQQAKESLLKEMVPLGVVRKNLEDAHLRVVVERAADLVQEHGSKSGKLAQLIDDLDDARHEADRRQREAQRADDAWTSWETEWTSAFESLGLAVGSHPAAVEAQVDVIDLMRERRTQIHNLRNERIAKIERDIQDFVEVTAALLQAVAPALENMAADEAVIEIVNLLNDAERVRDLWTEKQNDVKEREQQILELEEARDTARRSVRHLHDAAGTASLDALKKAIENSDRLRDHQISLNETVETLEKEGDGLSILELEEECAAIKVDEIITSEEMNAAELRDLESQRTAATEARSLARTAFEAVGGDAAAASAAAARQEALAEMGQVATRYALVRTSAILLRWGIDRFRREKQAPLLKRAGELFRMLTGGSFSELRIDYNNDDSAQLIGRRPNGENVEVAGMSSGTADQLYLALRVASVEDYLERAGGLPFVADDLFINFDDDRAAAGFQVLGQLAGKTQVLFFTHHQHLVDVARAAVGEAVNVVSLDGAKASTA